MFEALRWSETVEGATCVLLPNVQAPADGRSRASPRRAWTAEGADASGHGAAEEHQPALADRLFRAASGRDAWLAEDDQTILVEERAL